MKDKKLPPPGTGVCMYMYACRCIGVCVFRCRCCIGGDYYKCLKNNFNWKDAQEINNNTNISAINPIQQLSTEEIKQLLLENKE